MKNNLPSVFGGPIALPPGRPPAVIGLTHRDLPQIAPTPTMAHGMPSPKGGGGRRGGPGSRGGKFYRTASGQIRYGVKPTGGAASKHAAVKPKGNATTSSTANVLGKTASGKPVYKQTAANSRRYKGFSAQDHRDAARLHAGATARGAKNNLVVSGSAGKPMPAYYSQKRRFDHEAQASRLKSKEYRISKKENYTSLATYHSKKADHYHNKASEAAYHGKHKKEQRLLEEAEFHENQMHRARKKAGLKGEHD